MEDILDEIEKPISLSDQDIFTKIWLEPREVFQYIHQNKYDKFVAALLVLAGISRAFGRAISRSMGDDFSLLAVLLISLLAGGLLGWISYYLYAGLLSWTGGWMDGKGDVNAILRVVAYGMIPSILGLFLLVPQIAIYGNEIFKSSGNIYSGGFVGNLLFYGSLILELVLSIWTIALLAVGVSVVQGFGIAKSVFNLILPIIVIFVPIILLIWAFN